MTSYYDLVLGLIPLTLLGVTGTLHLGGGVALPSSITAGGLFAVGLIGHALFVRGPVDEPRTDRETDERAAVQQPSSPPVYAD